MKNFSWKLIFWNKMISMRIDKKLERTLRKMNASTTVDVEPGLTVHNNTVINKSFLEYFEEFVDEESAKYFTLLFYGSHPISFRLDAHNNTVHTMILDNVSRKTLITMKRYSIVYDLWGCNEEGRCVYPIN